MEKKKAIIEQLKAIEGNEDLSEEEAQQTLRSLMKEWNSIGFVPFKEKDKIYQQYRTTVDALFDRLNMSASTRKLNNFRTSMSNMQENGNSAVQREREKLTRTYEAMCSELHTYENNLGFLTAASKKGNSLVAEINRKVDKLKADIELVKQKIQVIDNSLKAAEEK